MPVEQVPPVVPPEFGILQTHSNAYRNPAQLPAGAVLVIGAGSSGTQIAVELARAGRHVTIAVSGAHGGETIDFRRIAARGVTLLGRVGAFAEGVMRFAPDLAENLAEGDASYVALLDAADAWIAREGTDLAEEPEARARLPKPDCVTLPILELDLATEGVSITRRI